VLRRVATATRNLFNLASDRLSDLTALLDFALALARTAEAEILPRFRNVAVTHKPDGTEVTEADREAERQMRAQITDRYPDHAILGEEFGTTGSADARYRWVLDPVDGTAGFTLGVPLFGTLIALLDDGEPVVGVIHFPALGETVYAARGQGCWFQADDADPTRVTVNPVSTIEAATISTTGPHSSDIMADDDHTPYRLSALIRQAGKFRFVTDCMQHALVARGRIHAAVDTLMAPWDIAALVPCVEEAGGIAVSLDGTRDDIVYGSSLISASSEALAQAVRRVLQPA
jgi:histidinol-phosphatase